MPLVYLDLSGNKTNLGLARAPAPHLPATLTHLNLSRVELGAGAMHLATMLRTTTRMRHLDLSSAGIDDGAFSGALAPYAPLDALVTALREMTDLTHLDLSQNRIYYAGALRLSLRQRARPIAHLALDQSRV
jgi:hypothetical protein